MPSAIAPIAGSIVGGLMSDGDSGGQQVSKDPWGPAQQPLRDILTDAERLRLYQQQNPWNALQQTAYQNTFTDLDAFRGQNDGLMQFANRLMGTNYQRGQPSRPAGLLSMQPQGGQQGMQSRPQGLLSPSIFSIPQGQQYGQLNWRELNPYTATNGAQAPAPAPVSDEERERQRLAEEERLRRQQGEYFRGAGA